MQKNFISAVCGAPAMTGPLIGAVPPRRGHEVSAFARHPERAQNAAHITARQGDLFDVPAMTAAVAGHDVIASAYAPPHDDAGKVVGAAQALVAIARAADIERIVAVGGAGSLEVAPGKQLVDAEGFPAEYKAYALAHRDALGFYRTVADIEWTFFAPAAMIAPGERKGTFRVGADKLIADERGNSAISAEDYAIAFVDEIEGARFARQIATVAY